jgi:hypothetical protein
MAFSHLGTKAPLLYALCHAVLQSVRMCLNEALQRAAHSLLDKCQYVLGIRL